MKNHAKNLKPAGNRRQNGRENIGFSPITSMQAEYFVPKFCVVHSAKKFLQRNIRFFVLVDRKIYNWIICKLIYDSE